MEQVNVSIGAKIDSLITEFQKAAQSVSQSSQNIERVVAKSMQQVEVSSNEATAALRRTEQEVSTIGGKLDSTFSMIGGGMMGIMQGVLASFSLEKAITTVLDFADTAEELDNVAKIAGTTATSISQLRAVVTPMGIDTGVLDGGMKRLAKTMTEAARGGEEQAAALAAVGISAEEVKNMSIEQVLAKIADRFSETEDGATKTALAQALLGRSGADLIPVLNQGSEEMRRQGEEAVKMGAAMGEDAVNAGLALDAAWDKLTLQGTGLKNLFAQALAPALEFIADAFTDGTGTATDFGTVFKAVATIVITATGVIQTAWNIVSSLVRAITVSIASIIDAVVKAAQMDWSGAKAALQTGDQMIREELTGMLDKQLALETKYRDSMNRMWGDAKPDVGAATPEGEKGQLDFAAKGDGGAADRAAAAKKAAEEEKRAAREAFELKMETLRTELAELNRGAEEKIAVAQRMTDAVKAQYGEESREYVRAQREQVRIVEEVETEKRRLKDVALGYARDHAQTEIALARGQADMLVATGQMTAVQRVQVERNAEEQLYALQLSYLEQRLALYAMEPQEAERINGEILRLKQEHNIKMQQVDLQTFEANKTQWDGYFQSITDGFANSIQGMVFQGLTLQQAMGNIFQNILGQLIQTGVKMAANWITTQLAMTGATVAGASTRTAAEVASAKASTMANAGAAIKNIITKAAEVFANVYNAIAGIPYVGPFLAPVMAVAAGAVVVGMVGKVASAEGGWDRVPYDGAQAILHKEEMVLPGPLAEGIRQMVESGQRGGPSVTIQAMDRRDVQRFFDDNADIYMRTLSQSAANNPGGI